MDCSIKIKLSIIKNLDSILNKEFNESNIKELLIDIREFIPDQDILREVADFMAHPTRDKGICHSDIDLIYTQLKFTYCNSKKERFNANKIPQKHFETFLIKGVDKIDNDRLYNSIGITKRKLQEIIKKNYKIRNKLAILENRYMIDDMVKGINYLMKTLVIKSVFKQEDFIDQFKNGIRIIQNEFDIKGDYVKAIDENAKDIMICILSLLHDAKIMLFDSNVGRLQIALIPFQQEFNQNLVKEIKIGLFVKMEVERDSYIDFLFCIIESNARAIDYIENFEFNENSDIDLSEIITSRIGGKLILNKP